MDDTLDVLPTFPPLPPAELTPPSSPCNDPSWSQLMNESANLLIEPEPEDLDEDHWHTDRKGLVFSYPPPQTNKNWMIKMYNRVRNNGNEFDAIVAKIYASLSERLTEATLLDLEVGHAVRDYNALFQDIAENLGEDVAMDLEKLGNNITVPRFDDKDSNVVILMTPEVIVEDDSEEMDDVRGDQGMYVHYNADHVASCAQS